VNKEKGEKAPKSNAERQANFRKKKLAEGLKEIRGLFVDEEQEKKVREFWAKLNEVNKNEHS
jgi:hypothetical protein